MWPLLGFELRFCFCYQPLLCLYVVDQEISTTAVYEDVSSDITKPPHNIAFHQNRPSSFKSSNGAHFLWPLIFFFCHFVHLKNKGVPETGSPVSQQGTSHWADPSSWRYSAQDVNSHPTSWFMRGSVLSRSCWHRNYAFLQISIRFLSSRSSRVVSSKSSSEPRVQNPDLSRRCVDVWALGIAVSR